MENLEIEGYNDVYFIPSVLLNAETGVCEIEGKSFLENPIKFYSPILEWLRNYMQTKNPLTFNFRLTYFNTSSSKRLLDILYLLKDYEKSGGKLSVNWFYEKDDIDIEEEVEDFMIESRLKINMIEEEE